MVHYWLAFTRVNGLGPVRLRQLRAHFDSIQQAWEAPAERLRSLGVPSASVEHLVYLRQTLRLDELDHDIKKLGCWVITLDDENYPPLLRELDDAPVVLYGYGDLLPEDQYAVAMVGTRRASEYGKQMASQLAGALASEGITVVSGLAHGIDTAAHHAALNAKGRTIAVLGSGIDVLYPTENRALAKKIVQSGALVTEFAPGTSPERGNFPIRNRIISGMTLGTVVIEAPEKSGSLQTATLASEQGREVFAVPGNANSPNSRGANLLIQDGAKLVLHVDDILQELNPQHRAMETRQQVKKLMPENALEARIIHLLGPDPMHVDELSRRLDLPIHEVNALVILMELKGMLYQTVPLTYHVTGAVETT